MLSNLLIEQVIDLSLCCDIESQEARRSDDMCSTSLAHIRGQPAPKSVEELWIVKVLLMSRDRVKIIEWGQYISRSRLWSRKDECPGNNGLNRFS